MAEFGVDFDFLCLKTYFLERKLWKYLEGMKKVSNFALAFGNEVRHSGADNTSPAKKFKKKFQKILVIQKLVVTLQRFSQESNERQRRDRTLTILQ